jgi:PAS domain S-box-containing protein
MIPYLTGKSPIATRNLEVHWMMYSTEARSPLQAGAKTVVIAKNEAERPIAEVTPSRDTGQFGDVPIFRDMAEARLAAEARQHLAAIVESAEDAIISKNLDGIILSWNKGAERLYGYTAEEVVGQPLSILVPSDHPDELPSIMERLKRGERIEHYETVRIGKDGGRVDVSLTISPIKNSEGHIIGASKIARDITASKRAEQTTRFLAEASADLAELTDYESTLQRVAGIAVPAFADFCAVDLLDPDCTFRRLATTHTDPSRLKLARELLERYPPRPDDRHGAPHVARSGQAELVKDIPNSLLANPDEEHLRILLGLGLKSYICVPMKSKGRTLGALTFVMAESGRRYSADDLLAAEDLADRAAVAVENAQLYSALREADRRKNEFLATLAHELRNPLAPIRNSVQVLRLRAPGDPELAWGIELIERQVQQLTRLVDDLLDLSRINRGKINLRLEAVDLAAVVRQAVETSRPLVDSRKHHLEVSLPEQGVFVKGDLTRLAQIVSNLLNNAAKFTDEGGRIELDLAANTDTAILRVRDTGVGIAPEMMPHIFEMFTQVPGSASGSEGGLGIGLNLAQNLIQMHGGSLQAVSKGLGHGSEFVVYLPLLRETAQPAPATARPRPRQAPTRRILIVDDNKDAAESLAVALRLVGHEVRTAYAGPPALEAARAEPPEVVLLDIRLPKMDGLEVARRLRQDLGLTNLLVVALTGYGQQADRGRTREAGFDAHFVKPVDLDAVQELLARTANKLAFQV